MDGHGLATSLAPRLDLPLRHLLAGAAFYLVAQVALLGQAENLARAGYLAWPLAGAAHLLTLGWATMVMMGATLQLVPVLLRVRLRSEPLARLVWWTFTIGTALLAGSLLAGRPRWLGPAGALLVSGVLLYAANVGSTLARAPRGQLQRWALAAATGFLVLTALLGATLALGLAGTPAGDVAFPRLLGAHLAAGLLGWMSVTVFAAGYRLIPMFALSHGYAQHRQGPAVALLVAGALALVLSSLGAPTAVPGALAAAAAYLLFALDVADIVRNRRRRVLEPVTRFTLAGLAFALASLGLAALAFLVTGRPAAVRLAFSAAYAFLGGWISLMVMGHLLKIVPFLTWLERYADQAGDRKVPLVRDLFSPWLGEAALLLTAAGAALVAAGVLPGLPAVVRAGLLLTLAGAVALGAALLQVRAGWRQPPRP